MTGVEEQCQHHQRNVQHVAEVERGQMVGVLLRGHRFTREAKVRFYWFVVHVDEGVDETVNPEDHTVRVRYARLQMQCCGTLQIMLLSSSNHRCDFGSGPVGHGTRAHLFLTDVPGLVLFYFGRTGFFNL